MPMIKNTRIPSRTEMVIERITEFIVSGQYSVGEILPPEKKLCEMFGISRSIIREAVKVLAAKGLLEVKQGFGTVVCLPKDEVPEKALMTYMAAHSVSLAQLMEVRAPLEIAIAKLAASGRTDEHLHRMAATFETLTVEGQSLDVYTDADVAFHQSLVDAAGNHIFRIIVNSIMQFLEMSRRLTIHHFGLDIVIKGHEQIYKAVADRDPKAAAKAMEAHMTSAARHIAAIGDLTGYEFFKKSSIELGISGSRANSLQRLKRSDD
jgi:GntR family transcriptional repressor for pyruvate dehydrogenase complex